MARIVFCSLALQSAVCIRRHGSSQSRLDAGGDGEKSSGCLTGIDLMLPLLKLRPFCATRYTERQLLQLTSTENLVMKLFNSSYASLSIYIPFK
mmetsp:Transcript_7556/g.13083  ORF Transcript_7556/g.13083 Transcript_7556/m.13083 type:complete len:94 (-) Transcript_7556:445-726(-)